jgi:hypothetical protein
LNRLRCEPQVVDSNVRVTPRLRNFAASPTRRPLPSPR